MVVSLRGRKNAGSYYPSDFLSSIAGYLPEGGNLIFGHPDLEYFLKNKFTNAINFEHSIFITDKFVDYLLATHGFSITKKYHYKNQHFFYHAVKLPKKMTQNVLVPNKYKEYKRIFLDYIAYHEDLITNLNQKIDDFSGDVYLFGAHIFSQYLFAFGLKKDKIIGILDNSPIKKGRRLYGSPLYVSSPDILRGKKDAAVIVKVGIYRNEVVKQIREINPQVTILE